MTTDRELARIVRSWLQDGVTTLPERLLDEVLDQVPGTTQRRALWPAWRFPSVNTPTRSAIAAAAVVVVAVVGMNLLSERKHAVGSPGQTPSPSTFAPSPTELVPILPRSGAIEPGRYRSPIVGHPAGAEIILTVPVGWTGYNNFAIQKRGGGPPAGMAIGAWTVQRVYTDPCHWQDTVSGSVVGPPTVDDLVIDLTKQPRRAATSSSRVTLDGFAGQRLRITVPRDIVIADCDLGSFRSWVAPGGAARYHQGPGQVDDLWILYVNGVRAVIDAAYFPATTSGDRAELMKIVDSIEFAR